LAIAAGRLFSASTSLVLGRFSEGALLDVPLDAPDMRRVHLLEPGVFAGLRDIAADAAEEHVYAIGTRGLHRFSLATANHELLRESQTFERVAVAPCPGEPGPTWTVTRTPTETATKTPSSSPTAKRTATSTPSPTPTEAATRTPTATSPPPASFTPPPTATSFPTPAEPTAAGTRRASPTPTTAPAAPTATRTPPVPGDADCDGMRTDADVGAALVAIFDPAARAACNADCNRDGDVRGADLLCTIAARAAP
jgi:hypothetical protein